MTRQLLPFSLVAFGLVVCAESVSQSAADSICPTCALPTAGTGVAGGGDGSASQVRCAEEATLTPEIAAQFGLETLRAYLERPNIVAGHFGAGPIVETARPTEPSATAELEFDLGEFSYYAKTPDAEIRCDDSVRVPAHVAARIGDGLLSLEADGVLWKGRNEPSAHFYASADLATATGSYRPQLDVAQIHVGMIEVSLHAAPGHLRGNIIPAVVYFRDEAQLQRHRQGDWGAALDGYRVLFNLGFPDDACADSELPFANDEPIERLGRQSAAQWRERAAALIAATTHIDAVWQDGSETEVTVELGEPLAGTVCLGKSFNPLAPVSELALGIPLAGRLRSADARLDIPLDGLTLHIDGGAVLRATLSSRLPSARLGEARREALGANADVLFAHVDYDFAREPALLDGLVDVWSQTGPNDRARVACIAFPLGGKADTGTCRYVDASPSLPPPLVNR